MESVKTDKGTVLPLMNLKGKPYMMVAHRIVWFNEVVTHYSVTTEFLQLTEERAVVKATVSILDKDGKVVKTAPGTKAESKKDFADFVEKAETGAVGRAITTLGFGTAYAIADLDEGNRIIDAPVTVTETVKENSVTAPPQAVASASAGLPPQNSSAASSAAPRRSSSFHRRPTAESKPATAAVAKPPATTTNGTGKAIDEWS